MIIGVAIRSQFYDCIILAVPQNIIWKNKMLAIFAQN